SIKLLEASETDGFEMAENVAIWTGMINRVEKFQL
ncbi:hypothetical protein A2U01_0009447, partial [Trifolium medium]|nr:hypothetical protein [Trifolium medium]